MSSKIKDKNVQCSIVYVQLYSYNLSQINVIVRKHIFFFDKLIMWNGMQRVN